uniref:Proton_antipo_M domain-containing protein n=1 Tax=Mesocestoides corti TaxID=53468 RepID=A0A5K3EUU5_MESCO
MLGPTTILGMMVSYFLTIRNIIPIFQSFRTDFSAADSSYLHVILLGLGHQRWIATGLLQRPFTILPWKSNGITLSTYFYKLLLGGNKYQVIFSVLIN